MKNKIYYSDRIFDPINYQEACYYIAQEEYLDWNTRECVAYMDFSQLLQWLGSNVGQSFIRKAKDLIKEYPYKEKCCAAIVCGKVILPEVVDAHGKWIEEKLHPLNRQHLKFMNWKQYKHKGLSEMRAYEIGEDVSHVSISDEDRKNGSPKEGDMIARNPKNHADQWLVARKYFEDNLKLA